MTVAAVLLAAGRSSRMGVPKALMAQGGETAIARLASVARDAGCSPVVAVLGRDAWWVRGVAGGAFSHARVVENPDPDAGRTGSLKRGLAAAAAAAPEAFLVWPVDHPDVTVATVRALIEAVALRGAALAVPTRGGKRGHPIALRADVAAEVGALDDAAPLRDVVARDPARVVEVEVDDDAVLANVDVPEAAARAGWALPLDNSARDNTCFVCSPTNDRGLRLQFYRTGDEVHADFTLDDSMSGYPGEVIDGVRYAVLSDALVWTAFGLTGTLAWPEEDARAALAGPVRTRAPARVVGRIAERDGDRFLVRAAIVQGGEERDAMTWRARLPTADDCRRALAEARAPASVLEMLRERLAGLEKA